MPRKNSRVKRSNPSKWAQQATAAMVGVRNNDQPPVRVEDIVLPDGQCRFMSPRRSRVRFATEEKAAAALKQAQQQRERKGSTFVEKRYYPCPEGGCGGYHLTSREAFDEDIWKARREAHR